MGDWDDFVEEHKESSFFHSFAWKKVIEKTYGFKPVYLTVKEKNTLLAILPLFEIRQLSGKKLISVPFSTEGGILYKTEKAKQKLIDKAVSLVKEKDLDYLELRQEKDIGNVLSSKRSFINHDLSKIKSAPPTEYISKQSELNTYRTELKSKDCYFHMKLILSSDPESVWKRMDKKARNAVRKAEKLGLTTDRGLKYLDDFYRIFSINMRYLGTPVDNKEFFQEIIRQFPKKVDIVVSKLEDKVIGAIFLVKHKNTIKSEWASSLRKYFGYNANQLMYWRAIEDSCREGFSIFDFGRSIEGEGTYKFKEKFGARPVRLHYKYFINKGTVPDIRKTSRKRKLFADIWSKLPLFIANSLGPKLREQFP